MTNVCNAGNMQREKSDENLNNWIIINSVIRVDDYVQPISIMDVIIVCAQIIVPALVVTRSNISTEGAITILDLMS